MIQPLKKWFSMIMGNSCQSGRLLGLDLASGGINDSGNRGFGNLQFGAFVDLYFYPVIHYPGDRAVDAACGYNPFAAFQTTNQFLVLLLFFSCGHDDQEVEDDKDDDEGKKGTEHAGLTGSTGGLSV
jgi:hypothetical protein